MSTFNGLVAEFPDIRVDFFRNHPDQRLPLACFLSHIHSDHLAGLESLRSPFVYCSAATRALLLRLEKYDSRVNYAAGILETRLQRFRHLKNLLKPIPLNTPTVLELEPGNHLQVTLIDANHCPGAVMFLFEGHGKAVLYTGDIRSEPWWVNSISRSPSLLEYAMGLKTLDAIYLDTTFLEDIPFPTKAEGIAELLEKVSRYPPDTIFHFQAWTYGYEDVWLALSKALGSKIHVDEYKMLIFRSLAAINPDKPTPPSYLIPEAPGLVGFTCGNAYQPGCLTRDENVRLHSCEKGVYCDKIKNSPVVWIRPIITRLPNGEEVGEAGAGGGGEDLNRIPELDYLSLDDVSILIQEFSRMDDVPQDLLQKVSEFILQTMTSGRKVPLGLDLPGTGDSASTDLDLNAGLKSIAKRFQPKYHPLPTTTTGQGPPTVITFPYSRHSSYPELCHFLSVFKPRDVWPCTFNIHQWLREGITIEHLFSKHCSSPEFRHDLFMAAQLENRGNDRNSQLDSQVTVSTASDDARSLQLRLPSQSDRDSQVVITIKSDSEENNETMRLQVPAAQVEKHGSPHLSLELDQPELAETVFAPTDHSSPLLFSESSDVGECFDIEIDPEGLMGSQVSTTSEFALEARAQAFMTVLQAARGRPSGEIGLMSTTDHHSILEEELFC